MKKILSFKTNEDGQSLVEFALVLPMLMALILGMIEFGWLLNGKITLTSAAREGARVATVYESKEDAEDPVQAAVSRAANNNSGLTDSVATITTFDVNNRIVIVSVTAKIKPIIGLYVGPGVIDFKPVTAEMRIE